MSTSTTISAGRGSTFPSLMPSLPIFARLGGLAAASLMLQSALAAEKKPNVIFILADDLGYTDVSAYGSGFNETPNIDRLAREGLKFTNGYTNGPNCQPTRAALISGQYAARTGVYTVGNIDRFNWRSQPLRPADNVVDLPLEKTTIAQSLKKAGYATGLFGKWHLGNDAEHHPSRRGFDEAIVSSGQHVNFKTTPPAEVPEGKYLADFLTDKAVDFIERHKDGPFFLYVPHFGVHSPYQAKAELIARFKDKAPAGGHHDPVYAAMLASVDESVGRITAKVDELGLAENTLIVFSSDNGGVGGYKRAGIDAKGVTDNAPLRAGKGSLHEGGIRVPYVFRWKGKIAPGGVTDTPIISVDLHPSLLALSGAPAPENQPLDGVSYAKLLTDPVNEKLERDLFWHFPGYLGANGDSWRTKPVSVVRSGDWKLIQSLEDKSLQLYNLKDDIGEDTNLAGSQKEKAEQLLAKLDAWRAEVKAPSPTANDPAKAQETAPKKGKKKKNKADTEDE